MKHLTGLKKLVLLSIVMSSLLGSLPSFAGFYSPEIEVYTVKTDNFYIHYQTDAADVARDLIDISERVHTKLSKKYKWQPSGRTHVVLVDNADSPNGLTTVLPDNYILLIVSPPDSDSSLANYHDYLEMLFTHEYTHTLHIDQYHKWATPPRWVLGKIISPNGLTPGWMREGIASWSETAQTGKGRGNSSYVDMILRSYIYDNNFPTISEVSSGRIDWPAANAQYYWGVRFIQYLADTYGEEKITEYMEKYSSGLWLFSLNNKAKRVFKKSFYDLWKEWKANLSVKYEALKKEISEQGVTPLKPVKQGVDQFDYFTPHPNGEGYAYSQAGVDDRPRITIQTKANEKPIVIKRGINGQLSFSKDGGKLAFSSLSGLEKFKVYSDVLIYDIQKKKMSRVYLKDNPKKSLRASHPDFSPVEGGDRWLVMVRALMGTDNLYVYDSKKKNGYFLTNLPKYTQLSNPRFSPDGKKIVVTQKDHQGNRDIIVYSDTGKFLKSLTEDTHEDLHPVWSKEGDSVYFASDRSGVPNIYKVAYNSKQIFPVTNVLTGVYQPQLSVNQKELYVKYFTSKGSDIYSTSIDQITRFAPVNAEKVYDKFSDVDNSQFENEDESNSNSNEKYSYSQNPYQSSNSNREEPYLDDKVDVKVNEKNQNKNQKEEPLSFYEKQLQSKDKDRQTQAKIIEGSKKYSAFPQVLVPKYIVPTFATSDEDYIIGATTGRFDPMYRHNWYLYGTYQSQANFVGAGFNYSYTRYAPTFFTGVARYAVNWGDILGVGTDFFEERLQGYAGAQLAYLGHNGSLSYFYETRDNHSPLPAGTTLANLDNYAGVRFNYTYAKYHQYSGSISQENGPLLKLNVDVTDSLIGSADANEHIVFTGDFRYYFEMPWSDHHVLGLKVAGGYVWGDQELQGSFRFGGPFGEGNLAGHSSRLFPFRGFPGVTFAGDRVLMFSGEYRVPLADVQKGIGTWPIYMKKLYASFFSDFGDSWVRDGKAGQNFFDSFFLSVGAELKSDFIIGYGMPVTARLGYAVIVKNRAQIAGIEDGLTGMDIRNGTVYFQFGTSF